MSVAVLAIISTISVYSLNTSRSKEEIRTAQRVLAADLRSLQARALNAQNILFCTTSTGKKMVCEADTALCADACTQVPPAGVGAYLTEGATTYLFYAKYDPATTNWKWAGNSETFLVRDLAKSGASNVEISGFSVGTTAHIAFQRQNGGMKINACPTTCTNDSTLTISLRHVKTGDVKTVTVYTLTGRIVMD